MYLSYFSPQDFSSNSTRQFKCYKVFGKSGIKDPYESMGTLLRQINQKATKRVMLNKQGERNLGKVDPTIICKWTINNILYFLFPQN